MIWTGFTVFTHLVGILFLFAVSYFLLEALRIPDNRRNKFRDLDIILLVFKKNPDTPLLNCKIDGKNFEKKKFKICPSWSEMPVSSFWEYSFLEKIYVGRKNTNSQFFFFQEVRKIQPFNFFYKWREYLILS